MASAHGEHHFIHFQNHGTRSLQAAFSGGWEMGIKHSDSFGSRAHTRLISAAFDPPGQKIKRLKRKKKESV